MSTLGRAPGAQVLLDFLHPQSLPAAQTSVTGKVETFCGQSPTKQTIRGMSGMQGMWCDVGLFFLFITWQGNPQLFCLEA